ncbi:lysine decarboxylase [Clostridia bacterium]|nr:lysine decarboxylase [Clostridia bacterium]
MGSLRDALNAYVDSNPTRFHMPGHKGKGNLESYDLTEIYGLDSLYESSGCIKELEAEIGEVYGCRSIISAGGSTLCIQTMISGLLKPGEKVILDRHIHISVLNTLILLRLKPVWIYREGSLGLPFGAPISEHQLDEALRENKDAKCVFITGEDYYGISPDIKALSQVCEKHNAKLLVDNAHGAYLKFLGEKKHPIDLGADMCCDSWHKTLPALTGAAVLNMKPQFDPSFMKRKMRMFGSSSPSYLIMFSMDSCLDYLKNDFEHEVECMLCFLPELKAKIKAIGFEFLNEGTSSVLKLVISGLKLGVPGFELDEKLRQHRIYVEYCDYNCVILLIGPKNSQQDFSSLLEALEEVRPKKFELKQVNYFLNRKLEAEEDLTVAGFADCRSIPIEKSEGFVAGLVSVKCPPCVPAIMPGEVVTPEVINILKACGYDSINVGG